MKVVVNNVNKFRCSTLSYCNIPIRLGNHNILQCVVLFAIQLSVVSVGFQVLM